jgi:hypothetical protein
MQAPALIAAARAVLERWHSPAWEWRRQGPTADLMASLEAAVLSADISAAAPQETAQEPSHSSSAPRILVDRALLGQALSDICAARLCEVNSMSSRHEMVRLMIRATDALRAALAQPDQCAEKSDCTGMPWCRIRNECQRVTLEQEEHKLLSADALARALVTSRIIDPAAIDDPDGYDAGMTLARVLGLHRRLIGLYGSHQARSGDLEEPAPPPEARTEAEKVAYAAGWWAALARRAKPALAKQMAALAHEPRPRHTPGPWQYLFEGGTIAFIVEADGTTVAKLSTTENTTAHSALPANVQLMAAGPDLLQALIGIVGLWDHHASAHGDGVVSPLHRAARAAIDKAEGRP